MLAAARKYRRVVQVGTQRRSTPHLIEARDRIIKEGKLGKIAPRRDLLLLPHARHGAIRPTPRRRTTSITRCGPGRRPCGPTTSGCIRAAGAPSWNTATASWATCAFTCSTWCAGCSTSAGRKRVSSTGGILVDKASKANISDTQTATFDFGDLQVVWNHRTWGDAPDPKYPVGGHLLRRQRHAQGQRHRLRLLPARPDQPTAAGRAALRVRQVSRGQDREGSGEALRLGHPRAHAGFARRHRLARPARGRHRTGPHLHASPASWPTSRCSSAAR